jgi:hypothetical protein
MVMNPRQEISLLKTQNSALEAKNAALEERVRQLEARAEPKPQTPAAKPPWATQSERTGLLYAGGPSVPQHAADGVSWVKERRPDGSWKDPCGQWRYASGELIPRQAEPRPAGPERGHQHAESVELLDNMIERDAARAETIKLLDPRGT